ncbi:hypothetical protein E2C01_055424 [Portunus trituberculatus]|uniref:Uncharacterized protein n=1 Tax=Portunus trituberculatus TaxID=210409 RepID=A0A5B7GXP5_PORTR|nr:hypothetical protein [Portunus trituberculatus]
MSAAPFLSLYSSLSLCLEDLFFFSQRKKESSFAHPPGRAATRDPSLGINKPRFHFDPTRCKPLGSHKQPSIPPLEGQRRAKHRAARHHTMARR